MAFNYPCDIEDCDVVLPLKQNDHVYISVNSDGKVLSAESNNGYAYAVVGTTKENLQKSIATIHDNYENTDDDDIQKVTLLEIILRWRALIWDGKPTLILGCEDYWCDTALCSPNGVLYPHAYTIVTYATEKDGTEITDEFNALICAGSMTQFLINVLNKNDNLLQRFYKDEVNVMSKPLIYLAEKFRSVVCEGSTCNVSMAIAHSNIVRTTQKDNDNV